MVYTLGAGLWLVKHFALAQAAPTDLSGAGRSDLLRDNLDILRWYIPDESPDLVYLDPHFNSNRDYEHLTATAS